MNSRIWFIPTSQIGRVQLAESFAPEAFNEMIYA